MDVDRISVLGCCSASVGERRGGRILGSDILASPDSTQTLMLEVVKDESESSAEGINLVWTGDGKLLISSPEGTLDEPRRDSERLSPDAFADASSERVRIHLDGFRSAGVVRFELRVMSGSRFSIGAATIRTESSSDDSIRPIQFVTINGGVVPDFPPALARVQPLRVEGGVEVTLSGSSLESVSDLRVLTLGSRVHRPEWWRTETGLLRFRLPNAIATQVRYVQVRDTTGRGSVEPCDVRAQVHPPVKNQVLVRLRDGFTVASLETTADLVDSLSALVWSTPRTGLVQAHANERYPEFAVANPSANATVPELLVRLRAHPAVESADSLSEGELTSTPTDPRWPYQWTLRTGALNYCLGTRPVPNNLIPPFVSGGSINANLAWDFIANGPPVGIGILDSGIHGGHEDFNGLLAGLPHMRSALIPGFNLGFDPDPLIDAAQAYADGGHGTPVAGLAAGRTGFDDPYSEGVSTASASRYGLPISMKCSFTNGTTVAGVVEALGAVVQNSDVVRVANISIGFNALSPTERVLLAAALRSAFLSGALLVAAIGNDGAPVVKYPAAMSDLVVAVGAVDWNNSRWQNSTTLATHCTTVPFPSFGSSYGSWLDVVAPGGVAVQAPSGDATAQVTLPAVFNCPLCMNYPHAPTAGFGGTSAAAPVVSGAAAWLLHVMPDLTSEDAGEVLRRSATDLAPPGFDIFHGHGSIDSWEATKYLHRPGTPILKWLHHDVLESQSGLAIVDSSAVTITLTNSPLAVQNNGGQSQPAMRYRLSGTAAYPAYASPPDVWVRRAGSLGADGGPAWDHFERAPWAQVVGSVGLSSCDFETYVYRLTNLDPSTTDVFYPSAPEAARVAFTVLGADTPLHVDAPPSSPGRLRLEVRSAVPGSRLEFAVHGGTGESLRASVFDLQGRRIANPSDSAPDAASPVLQWDGRTVSGSPSQPGMYLLRVEQGGRVATLRFLLTR